MTEKVRVGVAVWIIHEGRMLIGHRIKEHGHGSWAVPGGHLEIGESLEECAVRETEEEVGVRIRNVTFYTLTNDIFTESGKHYITIHMRAEADSADIVNREPHKYENWRWFTKSELPKPLFLPMENALRQKALPQGM